MTFLGRIMSKEGLENNLTRTGDILQARGTEESGVSPSEHACVNG